MTTTHLCPECGEPVRNRPPTSLWPAGNGPLPGWSHVDGEPLCPVLGRGGYRPATPVHAPRRGKAGAR